MKQCPKCSKEVFDSAMFCTYCGAKLEELVAEEVKAEESVAEESVAEESVAEESTAEESAVDKTVAEEVTADDTPSDAAAEETADGAPAAPAEVVPEPKAEPVSAPAPVVIEPEKKSGGKGKKIGIAVGVAVLVAAAGIGVAAVGSGLFKDPKDTVIDAFKSVYQEEKIDYMDEIFGYKELYKAAGTENMEVGMGLTLDKASSYYLSDYSGSGFDMLVKSDVGNQKYQGNFGFRYSGMDVVQADFYMDQSEIMLAIPELSKKVFTLNYADDLEGQIEKSPFLGTYIAPYMDSSSFDLQAAMEYNEYLTSIQNQEEGSPFNIKEMWERYKTGSRAIDDLKAAMEVKKGNKVVKIVDGKEQKCTAYEVVVPGKAVVQFAETTSEFFLDDETIKIDMLEFLEHTLAYTKTFGAGSYGIYGYFGGVSDDDQSPKEMRDELWEDAEDGMQYILADLEEMLLDNIMMTVYVDSKGRMAAIELTTELTIDSDTLELAFDAQLKGGDYLLQNVDMELTVTGDEEATIILEKSESYVNDVLEAEVIFTVEDDRDSVKISYSGSFAKANGDYEIELMVDGGDSNCLFTLEGVVEDFEKGKSINIIADKFVANIESSYGSSESLELSGNYSIKPLEGEVEQPSGDKMDILAATMMEWFGVASEIESNMAKFTDIFQ